MLPDVLVSMLVCPRCKGTLDEGAVLHCTRCAVSFSLQGGIPRMTDGAESRDERMAAEWQAQSQAHSYYADRSVIMNRWEEQVLPELVAWLGDVRGPILDVGCGVGHLCAALAKLNRHDVTLVGMDFQGELLEEARTGYAARIEADVHRLPVRDGAFGAAIASNSLHHFPDPETAMAEITRVLAPGGVFVAYDPRHIEPLERLKKVLRRNNDSFTKDHRAFRVQEFRDLIGVGGLVVTELRTLDPVGPLLATALDYLRVGRLGVADRVARTLARLDRRLAGRSGHTPLGLMLAARAVRPAVSSVGAMEPATAEFTTSSAALPVAAG